MAGRYLVAYMTAGYPDEERFLEFAVKGEDVGVDFLEVGIPPLYAKYDGPIIRRSYNHVRKAGVDVWRMLKKLRRVFSRPLIALTYLDEWASNIDSLLDKLSDLGVDAVLFPDMLVDYPLTYESYIKRVKGRGLGVTLFTSPSMPDSYIKRASELSTYFLYYGIRPTTGIPIPIDPVIQVRRVRKLVDSRLIVGFGLSPSDIPGVIHSGADGVAIGTSLITAIDDGGVDRAIDLLRSIRGVLDDA